MSQPAAGSGPLPSLPDAGGNAVGRGIAWMVLAMALLASMDAASKILVQTYSVFQLLWIRHLVLLGLLLTIRGPRLVGTLFESRRPVLQTVRVTALLVEMAMFMWAVRYLPLADTHALLAVSPLVVTALAWPILGEPVGLRRWFAVLVGFVGVLIIIRPGFGVFQLAALIPLAGAALWAGYQVMTRLVSRTDGADTAFVYLAVAGSILPGLLMPWVWITPQSLSHWLLFGLISLLGAGGHACLLTALRTAPAAGLQPFSYTLLIWAALWGLLIFGHFPDSLTIAGAALVVGSGLYTWHRERVLSLPR
ncbi:MAG: DMT family transporter [Geminicoccaceae bacterium]